MNRGLVYLPLDNHMILQLPICSLNFRVVCCSEQLPEIGRDVDGRSKCISNIFPIYAIELYVNKKIAIHVLDL